MASSFHLALLLAIVVFSGPRVSLAFTATPQRGGPAPDDAALRGGRVKSYNRDRGFGFIAPDAGTGAPEENVFAHQSSVRMDGFRYLVPRRRVRYRPATRDDGTVYAADVYPLEQEEATGAGGDAAGKEAAVDAEVADAPQEAGAEVADAGSEGAAREHGEDVREGDENDPFAEVEDVFKLP